MVTKVIHQDYLMKELRGRAVDHTGDGAQESRESLVVEDDYNRCRGK